MNDQQEGMQPNPDLTVITNNFPAEREAKIIPFPAQNRAAELVSPETLPAAPLLQEIAAAIAA